MSEIIPFQPKKKKGNSSLKAKGDRNSTVTSLVRQKTNSLPNGTVYDRQNNRFGVVIGKTREIEQVGFPTILGSIANLYITPRREFDVDYNQLLGELEGHEKLIGIDKGLISLLNMVPVSDKLGMIKKAIGDKYLYTFFIINHVNAGEIYAETIDFNPQSSSLDSRNNVLLKTRIVQAMNQRDRGGIVLKTPEEIGKYFRENPHDSSIENSIDYLGLKKGRIEDELRLVFHRLINRR